MKNTTAVLLIIVALLLSILMHFRIFTLPIQGKDTWRQCKTAWNIRYFVRDDANIFNPRQPYLNDENNIVRYEFPIMQWSIAMVEKVTGEHIIVMRLLVFLISVFTLLAVYKLALLLSENQIISAASVWVFIFFPTFFYNSTSIMPDNLALCFGMYYVYFFFRYLKLKNHIDLIYSAIFISLAGLGKLPFVLLGSFALVRFFEIIYIKEPTRSRQLVKFISINLLALLPVLLWYAIVVPNWKENNIQAGFTRNFAGWPLFISFLKNHLFVNFPSQILNIPSLILLFVGIYYCMKEKRLFFTRTSYFFVPLLVLFIYFFYILNVIREGHDYYLMPFYPVFILPIIFCLSKVLNGKKAIKIITSVMLISLPVICWFTVKDLWKIKYAYFNPDFFTCRDQLSSIGSKDDTAIIINDQSLAIFPYVIDKSGFIFWNDHLPVLWIKDMIKHKRPLYLYSDSRIIENQEGFNECISEMILECGSIHVYKLKTPDEIQL